MKNCLRYQPPPPSADYVICERPLINQKSMVIGCTNAHVRINR